MTDDFKEFFRSIDPEIEFKESKPVEEIKVEAQLEGEELDSLVGEIGIERQAGENDANLRERGALEALEKDAIKSLEIMLGKRKNKWHPDEQLLLETFSKEEQDKKEKFITAYIHREEVTKENITLAAQHSVMFPQFCVLENELREVMTWFLGNVPPWDRDPCFGCTRCMMGKHPETR